MQKELFEQLCSYKNIKINKITSPRNFTSEEFIQNEDEFVFLVSGEATLEIGEEIQTIKTGEHIFIKSGVKHKIISTSKSKKTIWLTVHIF